MYCSSKLFWLNCNNKYPKNFWADKPEELLVECMITLQQCKVTTQRWLLHFNRNFQCLKLPEVYINMIRRVSKFFKFYLFVGMNQALCLSVTYAYADVFFLGFTFFRFTFFYSDVCKSFVRLGQHNW